jgi:hypothetical protein
MIQIYKINAKPITFLYTQLFLFASFFTFGLLEAQITLGTDFTDSSKATSKLHNVWTVANRISPSRGVSLANNMSVNVVRMVGGITKMVNGKQVPNYAYDPCRYDSISNTYVYNWKPLFSRIDKIKRSNTKIHQIVLDQPCWAFQHGYNFLPDDVPYNGTDFKESERVSIYGNSLPPKDKKAYAKFITAMLKALVKNYGKKQVLKWRFRVGSEIETPDHWRGTKQDFINYFAITEKAIRAVLPDAKIGIHTRTPDFLFKAGKVKNYKGEVFASFASSLISYCYDHDVRYDFWGISDYVIVNDYKQLQIGTKYETLFAPLIEHPKWQAHTILDVMEYASVTSIKGRNYMKVSTTHSEIIDLAFSHMFYTHNAKGLDKIYRWGMRKGSKNTGAILELNKMVGKTRYNTIQQGAPALKSNTIKALFAKKEASNNFDALLYSFNDSDLNEKPDELVHLEIDVHLPVGSKLKYRKALYSKSQNKFQSFLESNPNYKSIWLKPKYDKRGDPIKILNTAGKTAWNAYIHKTPYAFSEWKTITTTARHDNKTGSLIALETQLPSFSYEKYEFRL